MRFARRFPPNPRYQPVFSGVEGVRGWSAPHWRAELHDHGDGAGPPGWCSHPVAIAWVTEYPEPHGPMLDYLIVLDHWRGTDLGPRLAAECERRWPDIRFTERLAADGKFRGE